MAEPAETPVDRATRITIENWQALGVEEHAGVLHMPAAIKRRTATGAVEETRVMLRNVTNEHRFRCRNAAREHAKLMKLDLDRDRDMVGEIENYALLAYAIRDPKSFDQHVPGVAELVSRYDAQSLVELWGVYNAWLEMLDPRYGELDDEQLWQVIVRIAKEKHIGPLVALPGVEQHSCIIAMALAALRSPMAPSWLQPPETLRQVS